MKTASIWCYVQVFWHYKDMIWKFKVQQMIWPKIFNTEAQSKLFISKIQKSKSYFILIIEIEIELDQYTAICVEFLPYGDSITKVYLC